jgi:hypothetical protein
MTKQATKLWRQARAERAGTNTRAHRDKPPPPPIPDAAARVAAVKAAKQRKEQTSWTKNNSPTS